MFQPPTPFPILYEDNHLLAVVKPAGIATMGVSSDRDSVLTRMRGYVKSKYGKPGNVYLGVVSRLDAPVTGVLLLARTSKAAARLNDMFRSRRVEKTYWAIVEGTVSPPQGTLVNWIESDERHRRVRITEPNARAASEARLQYRVLETISSGRVSASDSPVATLVEIDLQTGRKHQIRVQFAAVGHPIIGDRKYGSRVTFSAGIALHARRLALEHPVRHVALELVAPPPPAWHKFGMARVED